MKDSARDRIVDAARAWIKLMPGGLVFRSQDVQRQVLGTEVVACQARGTTRLGKPRFRADVSAAIRWMVSKGFVRKLGGKWQRTGVD